MLFTCNISGWVMCLHNNYTIGFYSCPQIQTHTSLHLFTVKYKFTMASSSVSVCYFCYAFNNNNESSILSLSTYSCLSQGGLVFYMWSRGQSWALIWSLLFPVVRWFYFLYCLGIDIKPKTSYFLWFYWVDENTNTFGFFFFSPGWSVWKTYCKNRIFLMYSKIYGSFKAESN